MSASLGEESSKRDAHAQSLDAALRNAPWEEILPKLLAYAERRLRLLGWAAGRYYQPAAMEVQELVNEGIVRCYGGERQWNEQNPPELVAFLCGVIRSVSSDQKKMRRRSEFEKDNDMASVCVVEAADAGAPLLSELERAIQGDDDLENFYLAVVSENCIKREDIARCLGWTTDKVSVVRRKLNRRLTQLSSKERGT